MNTEPTSPPSGLASPSCYALLDLFCCEGGAGMGYAQAGWTVTGVDIVPRPRNPNPVIIADALEYIAEHGHKYDFIHASPPCQGYSNLTPEGHKGKYPKLIHKLREILANTGKPYVIENVAGARHDLENPVMLCGSMFGLRTQRHRYFETSFPVTAPRQCDHSEIPLLVTTASKASREKRFALGMKPKTVANAPLAYGIEWMSCDGLKECIPPAYTRWIAEQFLLHKRRVHPWTQKKSEIMTTPSWADSPIHAQIRAAGLDPVSERAALGPSDATACSACGHVPRRTADYGDFTEYEVRRLVAEYCMSVTLGNTGWGVPFKVWVELHGIARHDKMHRLIRLPNA